MNRNQLSFLFTITSILLFVDPTYAKHTDELDQADQKPPIRLPLPPAAAIAVIERPFEDIPGQEFTTQALRNARMLREAADDGTLGIPLQELAGMIRDVRESVAIEGTHGVFPLETALDRLDSAHFAALFAHHGIFDDNA